MKHDRLTALACLLRPSSNLLLGFAGCIALASTLGLCTLSVTAAIPPISRKFAVVEPSDGSFMTRLASRELRRYLYLRTGELAGTPTTLPKKGDCVVLTRKTDPMLAEAFENHVPPEVRELSAEQYLIRPVKEERRIVVWVVGGDDPGLLYGAYRFCELLGVRFYLHGDVVPDEPFKGGLPAANETGKPLFSIRGIQPFHDFPEGPDWWQRDDFLAYVAQLPKLRMNFLGLHCYPENHPHAEPSVWIGLSQDHDDQGRVQHSHASFWANTRREGHWGYRPMPTSEFSGGADQLFPGDDYGHEIQTGMMPAPQNAEQGNELFNRAGVLFREVFTLARQLGVKTAIGTETPLLIPQAVQDRLKSLGKDPKDPAVARELYEGMFRRILKTHPLDYYWLWTPEGWTWEGNRPEQFAETARDLKAAQDALKALGDPFTLATSGWVLGPAHDRTALDQVLPKNCPMSCINREVGHDLIEAGFGTLQGRPKWSIPWMENDPNLTSPQLWVGRMRYDAADSLKLGCTGLIGIHWRTKSLAPNIAALAGAAWDQSFTPARWDVRGASRGKGHLGGKGAFSAHPVEGTTESLIYQWMREGLEGYDLDLPNGIFRTTLKFSEPNATQSGQRVFGIKVQGRTVLERLDIFERAGQHRALDLTVATNQVSDGHLRLEFTRITGAPCVSAIIIEGQTDAGQPLSRKVNCGFDAMGEYERDGSNDKPGTVERRRSMPIEPFFTDFARTHFGDAVAGPVGRLFTRIDGMNLPQSAHWERGPGGINPLKPAPSEFRFVDELEALRPQVRGAGNSERFDYWLNTFRYMRAMSEVGGLRAEMDAAMARALKESDPVKKKALAEEALKPRLAIARAWERMMSTLVAATDTPGELGTIANHEQHNRKFLNFLGLYDSKLAEILGQSLPPEATPARTYSGPARIIVPTVRGERASGAPLKLRVFAVDREPVRRVELHWRSMGYGKFQAVQAQHVGRSVYEATVPPGTEDIEYHLTAVTAKGQNLTWPATAPRLCQTVIALH